MREKLFFTFILGILYSSCSPTKEEEEFIDLKQAPFTDMELVWSDEFNENRLDTMKWSTNYFSNLNMLDTNLVSKMKLGTLPQPTYTFTDKSIILYTDADSSTPGFEGNRKISSIQTYDWRDNKDLLNNRVGGYIEARIRRDASDDATKVNGAFWLDSPGPDLRYYYQQGTEIDSIKGIRPDGQVFEIDLCEYITTEIVLHGKVDEKAEFKHNIGHYIVDGNFKNRWTTHGIYWSPRGLKFYIDGVLVKEYWDKNNIKSPNHFMNIFLGAYGEDGKVTLEADYIRYFDWILKDNNLLPNGDFSYNEGLFPWEGEGTITTDMLYTDKNVLMLKSGESIEQYLFLPNSKSFNLDVSNRGDGLLTVDIDNIEQVTGKLETKERHGIVCRNEDRYCSDHFNFDTSYEPSDNMKTIIIRLTNTSLGTVYIENVSITKINS